MASTARDVIAAGGVVTHFQPIFSARQKSIVGLEALARGIDPRTAELIPPAKLFAMAAEERVGGELEQVCRETAIRTFAKLGDAVPAETLLFLNYNPSNPPAAPVPSDASVADGSLLFLNFDVMAETAAAEGGPCAGVEAMLAEVRRLGLEPNRIAVEILESQFDDVDKLKDQLALLRECGFLLVLDDVGAGHANLDRIPLIRPDVIKVDRSLIRNVDSDYHKQETFKSLAHLARKIGALVVAEGVETKMEALVSLELGADFLQGFYLARPQRPDLLSPAEALDAVEVLAREYKQYMVRQINARKLQHRRYNILLNTILMELARTDVSHFDEVLRRTIAGSPMVECLYVLDESGVQITDTVCQPNAKPSGGLIFRPARKGTDHSLKEFYYVLLDVELQKYTTDPYVSMASGNVCRTISTCFRDANNNKMYILCIDVCVEQAQGGAVADVVHAGAMAA